MRAIETITGRVSVLNRDDVDTDQIIPKQFLKRVERTGFGEFLFYDWAKEAGWELPRNPILVAGRNFGCGSSREHAPGYDRVSDPQLGWAREQLERLSLAGDEVVLDAGCGSGRVTALLADRLPRGRVYAVDAAPSMVEHARKALGDRAVVLCQDL